MSSKLFTERAVNVNTEAYLRAQKNPSSFLDACLGKSCGLVGRES